MGTHLPEQPKTEVWLVSRETMKGIVVFNPLASIRTYPYQYIPT